MENVICPECGSEDVYFSKKKQCYVCEDCEHQFLLEKKNSGKKIFFSYAHDKNEKLVLYIKKKLEERGYEIWIDRSEIKSGDDWRKSITDGLIGSQGVIAFLSKHSVRSPGVCLDELRIALNVKHGNIRTVLLENENEVIPPASISDIQWLDMSNWSEKSNQPEEWGDWYDNKINELCKVIDSDEFVSFSGEIKQISDALKVSLTDTKEQLLSAKQFIGRQWLKDAVENWRNDQRSSKVFLLLGSPGIGKSAFAANLIHYDPAVICGFFCEWDKETKRDPRCIIKSISYRISTKLPDYRKLLLAKMEARASDYYEQLTASELFEQLITQPLSEMIDGNREKQIIVIDGLDETDENGENIFADILADNADKLPRWIGLLITSRPESNIKRAFAGFNPNEYDPASSFNYEDIKQYILKNLSDELAFTNYPDSIVSEILNNCDGNFLYASLFVDAVKNGAINLSDKNTYPKGLNSIHFQNFKRKYPVRDDYSIPRKILEIIIASDSMPVELLCRIAGIDSYEFQNFRESIGSIIVEASNRIGNGNSICKSLSFCHKSIQDWLTDAQSSGRFYIDPVLGYKRIAEYYKSNICKTGTAPEHITINEYIDEYIRNNYIECLKHIPDWEAVEQFLLEEDTPLFPYWKCLNDFPNSWPRDELLDRLWNDTNCSSFFNGLQRSGERKYVFDTLELLKNKYGIRSFDNELFETYVDIVHLGGDYKKAVQLYDEYLSGKETEQLYTDPVLLHYNIRRIHHSMFFAPVKSLIAEALEVFTHMDENTSSKDYNEMLFLLGGNLGVLSGDFQFAEEWLSKADAFAAKIGNRDFQSRSARKKADLLCLAGKEKDALDLINEFVTIDTPLNSRYEIYLLGALAETYRQLNEIDKAVYSFNKLLSVTQLKGLSGWLCHAYLGLAHTIQISTEADYQKVLAYLSQADEIYKRTGQAWGIINSEIVRFSAMKSIDISSKDFVIEAMEVKKYASDLQYAYEEKALDKIINNGSVDNYRLLFL